jgi:hypothetical protein
LEKGRLEKGRLEKGRLEQLRFERERLENERLERDKLEREKFERRIMEILERKRLEREREERERLERENMIDLKTKKIVDENNIFLNEIFKKIGSDLYIKDDCDICSYHREKFIKTKCCGKILCTNCVSISTIREKKFICMFCRKKLLDKTTFNSITNKIKCDNSDSYSDTSDDNDVNIIYENMRMSMTIINSNSNNNRIIEIIIEIAIVFTIIAIVL